MLIRKILVRLSLIIKIIVGLLKSIIPVRLWRTLKKHILGDQLISNVEEVYTNRWKHERAKRRKRNKRRILPDGFNLLGYLQSASGLGEGARSLHKALKTTKIPYELIDYDVNQLESQLQSKEYGQFNQAAFKYNINLIHINPPQLPFLWQTYKEDHLSSRYNIGVWYWELSEFPDRWINRFDLVDEVWVATKFVFDSIAAKSPVPVHIIPPCVEVETNPELSRSDFNLPEDRFLFLCAYDAGSVQMRKNPQATIDAFTQAFDDHDSSVGLIVKINNGDLNSDGTNRLKQILGENLNIFIIEDVFPRVKFNTFLSLIDVYVSLHRSEGFGLIPAEAMYLGKPVIMTQWSGNVDFMSEDNCCGVDYELGKINHEGLVYDPDQLWAEPRIETAISHMRRLRDDPDYYQRISQNAHETILRQYSPTAIGKLLQTRFQQILE